MDDKIKIYESLLNEKASLEKDCFRYSFEYLREFGDEIEALFELKVEVVTLKKKIAFCVRKDYRNEPIYSSDLDKYIDEEILDYQRRLQELIEYNKAAKEDKGTLISFEEGKKIKKLYYKIAHLIHPDLHPEYKEDEEMFELWNKAVTAYKCNDYKSLVETYDKIIIKVSDSDVYIDNIDGKIEVIKGEINDIKENEPYTYKFILDDDVETKEYHENLKKEINDYEEYKANLERELSHFKIAEGYDA